jgi:hypothetical protein
MIVLYLNSIHTEEESNLNTPTHEKFSLLSNRDHTSPKNPSTINVPSGDLLNIVTGGFCEGNKTTDEAYE